MSSLSLRSLCVFVALFLYCSFAQADPFEWSNAAGGDFATPGNWTPSGPPGIADNAIFNLNSAGYSVIVTRTNTVNRVNLKQDIVTLTGGGALASKGAIQIATLKDSASTLTVANAKIKSGEFGIGNDGVGTLLVQSGGTVECGTAIVGNWRGATGVATMDGGQWDYSGNFVLGWESKATGTMTANNGATINQTNNDKTIYVGYLEGSRGTIVLEGENTTWTTGGGLRVGDSGQGEVTIRDNAAMTVNNASIGFDASGTGTLTVDGGQLTMTGDLAIGGRPVAAGGSGFMTIKDGSTVEVADTTKLWGDGLLYLQGGQLMTDTIETKLGGFAWSGGELNVTGEDGLEIGPNKQIAAVTLSAGKALTVDNTLTVYNGGTLSITAGSLSCGELVLDNGTVTGGSFDVDDVTKLSGYGVVNAAISGSTSSMIVADGSLVLGKADSTDGFDFDGTLKVKTYDVTLLDSNRANLGESTTMGDGGTLTGIHGLRLDAGDVLTANGNGLIQGELWNDGTVNGPTGESESLVLDDNVMGGGFYSGNIEFRQGFAPGNSPGIISFGDGNAIFDVDSTLTMEIFGLTSGEFDQLIDIDNLDFRGTLEFVFGYSAAKGDTFDLLDFVSFSGAFDNIVITGLDSSLTLDTSQLATTGVISIVPEPASLTLLGIGALSLVRRRRDKGVGSLFCRGRCDAR